MQNNNGETTTATSLCWVDWETLELVVHGPYEYRVDLERCNTPGQVLDYVLQVNGKTWCTPDLIKAMLDALELACRHRFEDNDAQGVLCPCGTSKRVNWRTGHHHRKKNQVAGLG